MRSLRSAIGFALVGLLLVAADGAGARGAEPQDLELSTESLKLSWGQTADGWAVERIRSRGPNGWLDLPHPQGEYGVNWSASQPDLDAVQHDRAGESIRFLPETGRLLPGGGVEFRHSTEWGDLIARWHADPSHPTDVKVELQWDVKRDGYVSLASPTLATVTRDELAWGTLPGQWQGDDVNPDYNLAFKYGQGLPASPGVKFEHTTTTLSPMLQTASGITIAAIPDPGVGRDPYQENQVTHRDWRLGLSTMNRAGSLTPQLYSPVLGGTGSFATTGQTRQFPFRFSVANADWFDVYKHVIYDLYDFKRAVATKSTKESLTTRLGRLQGYLEDPATSRWRTDEYEGAVIGAQDYLGLVKEADNDAMKNSDVGAMWMTAGGSDSVVTKCGRLPYVRNFKLAQQRTDPGFFTGSPVGQYYLHKSNRFVEEFGPYVEPLGLTYYTIIDMANILNFDPGDQTLRNRLRLGADKLLDWQKQDGSWDVAYDRESPHGLTFPELRDFRPTWYGLLVAYQELKDQRYLAAAQRGADWFVDNGVAKGHYLGSTGDSGFLMDLSMSQSAQGLLELAELTGERRYETAAVEVAKTYTTWVYTHPTVSDTPKQLDGRTVADWEISQVGLQKEQNATAAFEGPILLNSHAATFLRFYELTKQPMFRDMARTAVLGRDAFTDPTTGVQSYYWRKFGEGPGPFPHHAWWQIGWITDYLATEAKLRSKGEIALPSGPFTPKVGGQVSYGFAPGQVYGQQATLHNPPGMLRADDPQFDVLGFKTTADGRVLAVVLNNSDKRRQATVSLDPDRVRRGRDASVTAVRAVHGDVTGNGADSASVEVPAWGHAVVEFDIELGSGRFTQPQVSGAPDKPVVSWDFGDADSAALEFREVGASAWTRNDATRTCEGFSAEIGPVDSLPANVEYRLTAVDSDGVEHVSQARAVRLYDPGNPGQNLALDATATATSTLRPETGAAKAVDGNTTDAASRWISGTGDVQPQLRVDLGSPATIDVVRLHSGFEQPKDTVASFTVEAMVDGEWQELGSVSGNSSEVVDVAVPGGVRASELRLIFTDPSSTTPDVARVFELEVYGSR